MRWVAAAIAASLVATPAASLDAERRVPLSLRADGMVQILEDSITGFEAVSYVMPLQEGQTLQVALASSNAANCFDIHAPGATKPFYVSAESGNSHRLQVQASGDYTVRVFLLRFAARDGQSARYELELTLAP